MKTTKFGMYCISDWSVQKKIIIIILGGFIKYLVVGVGRCSHFVQPYVKHYLNL